ncbi:hypothetical protein BCV69DRAFT_253768 [Microstroma glucosiphilum]|uniref:CENP-V/GFA domain-containing protein n=1 Tax=Pseudomicrostroma glucosiphilum TaxID=1684307 RepID=A0A316TWU8_9BASI|nr:hypothetical protein BCV69DRAFT_253768 [Pseudomicrostroma glucosiphilum]PWN17787.1 hypothetical protein BCV69DRAFT_253768 [Pseudomicrostroma glucosiphilum]
MWRCSASARVTLGRSGSDTRGHIDRGKYQAWSPLPPAPAFVHHTDQTIMPEESKKKEQPSHGWNGPVPSSKGGTDEKEYMFKPPYYWYSDEFEVKWTSNCWCGKVRFQWAGEPVDGKHCHCKGCQRLHGAPFQYCVLFPKLACRMDKECDPTYLSFFSTQRKENQDTHDVPCKVSCRQCRSPLLDEGRNMLMAYPSSFNFPDGNVPPSFSPSCHIFYKEAIIEIDDGVPKWSGHKDTSELMPHASGHHGKVGHGKSGKQARGESHDPDMGNGKPEDGEGQQHNDDEREKKKDNGPLEKDGDDEGGEKQEGDGESGGAGGRKKRKTK